MDNEWSHVPGDCLGRRSSHNAGIALIHCFPPGTAEGFLRSSRAASASSVRLNEERKHRSSSKLVSRRPTERSVGSFLTGIELTVWRMSTVVWRWSASLSLMDSVVSFFGSTIYTRKVLTPEVHPVQTYRWWPFNPCRQGPRTKRFPSLRKVATLYFLFSFSPTRLVLLTGSASSLVEAGWAMSVGEECCRFAMKDEFVEDVCCIFGASRAREKRISGRRYRQNSPVSCAVCFCPPSCNRLFSLSLSLSLCDLFLWSLFFSFFHSLLVSVQLRYPPLLLLSLFV